MRWLSIIYISVLVLVSSLFISGCSEDDPEPNGNEAISVEITSPSEDDTIFFPQSIVAAVEADGEITSVEIFAAGVRLVELSAPPFEAVWTYYAVSGNIVIKVRAEDTDNNVAYDSISVFVPVQEYDFILTVLANSSHNAYLGWVKSDQMFFHKYALYMSEESTVDSTDMLVASIENRQSDTTAFIDNLQSETGFFFIVYSYTQTGDVMESNIAQLITGSTPSPFDDGTELIDITSGEFTMGDVWGGAASVEYPAHLVLLDSYSIYKYEVTCAQYKEFIDAGGYSDSEWWDSIGWLWKEGNAITEPYEWNAPGFPCGDDYPDYPVIGVSWYEAIAYANFVGRALPTAAQWECAARGRGGDDINGDSVPDGVKFPWGSDFYADGTVHCNYLSGVEDIYNDDFEYTAPIGSFSDAESPYGLVDMAGNAGEWCSDWYDPYYYTTLPYDNPTGPESGSEKVFRGGSHILVSSMDLPGFYHRNSSRDSKDPESRRNFIGFRLIE